MTHTHLSIGLDLANGDRIGPGKIALLEAIRGEGSISAAARHSGISYRRGGRRHRRGSSHRSSRQGLSAARRGALGRGE